MKEKHHVKYLEIDGVDEFIWVTKSEHSRLNKAAAKSRGFMISKKISNRAHIRLRRNQSIQFKECFGNCFLIERIRYNPVKQTINCFTGFYGDHGVRLPIIKQ